MAQKLVVLTSKGDAGPVWFGLPRKGSELLEGQPAATPRASHVSKPHKNPLFQLYQ